MEQKIQQPSPSRVLEEALALRRKEGPPKKTGRRAGVLWAGESLIGKRYGRLEVIDRDKDWVGKRGDRIARWICVCDCGEEKSILGSHLRSGKTVSCGCLRNQIASVINATHGATTGRERTPTYVTWLAMKTRCSNPNQRSSADYLHRGIRVCDEWNGSFDAFLRDMGERPAGMTIERKNVNLGYFKENCRWADAKMQANNKTNNRILEFRGERKTVAQWSSELGIPAQNIYSRLHQGWGAQRALSQPVKFSPKRKSPCA